VGLGHWEILAIAVAILLIFGGKKIPELMKGVGSGMREFRKGIKGEEDEPPKEALNDNKSNDSQKN